MKIFKSISEVQSQTVGATLGWPHYSHKNVDGVMVLNLCTSSDDPLYFTKFRENNQRVSDFLADVICILKFAKGHNSVKSIGGVMVLGSSTSSDNALNKALTMP